MKRILVPVDGSESSNRAVTHAAAMAGEQGEAEIHLLYVHSGRRDETRDLKIVTRLREADFAFEEPRAILKKAGLRYGARVEDGDPAQEIARYADTCRCDQIVMGTRGMGGVGNLVLGSTAMKTLHLVRVPVTLVK